MTKPRKVATSWQDKLRMGGAPVVKRAPLDFAGMKAGQVMLVPTPKLIEDFLRAIPPGKTVEVKAMRAELARRHGAEVTCPIYTGFHLRTVAEAAYEQHLMGATLREIAPFWRVINLRTPLARRLACGLVFVRQQRLNEQIEP